MNRLAKMIKSMNKQDLLLLQKDVDSGNIEKLIATQLEEIHKHEQKTCPVCGGTVNQGIKIEFGPRDLRMTATFDGPDCLQYFTEHTIRQ